MKQNVVLKKDFRGLAEGTEFVFDEQLQTWRWETSEEEINDSSVKNYRAKVQFSDGFVKANPDVFLHPELEKAKTKDEELIEKMEAQIKNLQVEIDKLRK
jgi:hypothetical protein